VPDPGLPSAAKRWGIPSRTLWLVGSIAFVVGLAFLVGRARTDQGPAPYKGVKGGDQTKAAGIKVFVTRGLDVRILEPGARVRAGDSLRVVLKADRPRYVEIRLRDSAGQERRLFPAGEGKEGKEAALVRPGEALPAVFRMDDDPRRQWLVVRLSEHPFAVGQPGGPEVQVVRVDLDKEK
jgi:hypothetical protein